MVAHAPGSRHRRRNGVGRGAGELRPRAALPCTARRRPVPTADEGIAMSRLVEDAVARYLRDSCAALERAAVADRITRTFRAGGKVLLAGNGGSAADAQHIAAEFLSRFKLDRSPLPAIALTTDSSVLTAIGNDYGFAEVFERQVRGLGRAGDVFIGLSTSGRSENVLAAL